MEKVSIYNDFKKSKMGAEVTKKWKKNRKVITFYGTRQIKPIKDYGRRYAHLLA